MNRSQLALAVGCLGCAPNAMHGQGSSNSTRTDNLPVDKGLLSLSNATVTLSNGNLQIVFIPLDERILRLITKDSYRSMKRLLDQQQKGLDSAMSATGLTSPGIAFVSFQGLAANTRFEPEQLTITYQGQQLRPVAWVSLSPMFSNQQLDIRQQVQALFIYRREIPVRESFRLTYLAATSDDWAGRLSQFDAERSRILGTVRPRGDTTGH